MEPFSDAVALKETWPTIPLVIAGEDLKKQSFTDAANVVMARGGAIVWETSRELQKFTLLKISHERSGCKTVGKVQWTSPQGDAKSQIWVDIEGADVFWKEVVSHEVKAKAAAKASAAAVASALSPVLTQDASLPLIAPMPIAATPVPPLTPMPAAQPAAIIESPAAVQKQVPQPAAQPSARLTDVLNEMVQSSLNSNLAAAVTRITSEIQSDLAKMQASVHANLQQSIQTAVNTFSSRIAVEATEIVTQTGTALDTKLKGVTQAVASLAQESEKRLQQNVEDTVWKGKEKIQSDATAIVSEALRAESEIKTHLEEMSKQTRDSVTEELNRQAETSIQHAGERIEAISKESEQHARETFVQNMMMELIREHEAWFAEARRILQEDADKNVLRMRQEIGQFVKSLGESMVENSEHALQQKL